MRLSPRVLIVLSLFLLQGTLFWSWEKSDSFNRAVNTILPDRHKQWVNFRGEPVSVSGGRAANDHLMQAVRSVEKGIQIGDVQSLVFPDPNNFEAGELHRNVHSWEVLAERFPSLEQQEVLTWIREKVSIDPYFRPFRGRFKGEQFDSERPPQRLFKNNISCKPFISFIQETLLQRLRNGAISLVGKVGQVDPHYLVLPLTVEPTKPRLCHDARFLNLWIVEKPFTLDKLLDLPRYVFKDSYQTVLDDKSGYDHLLLAPESRTYFGIQWGGWYFTYNTLPFGWKLSPYIYQTTGLMVSNFLCSIEIPCLLYIDDRHNGQLLITPTQGPYAGLKTPDERNYNAAKSAIFLVAYYLICLGYFLGLSKSILIPQKDVPYLGFYADSVTRHFL